MNFERAVRIRRRREFLRDVVEKSCGIRRRCTSYLGPFPYLEKGGESALRSRRGQQRRTGTESTAYSSCGIHGRAAGIGNLYPKDKNYLTREFNMTDRHRPQRAVAAAVRKQAAQRGRKTADYCITHEWMGERMNEWDFDLLHIWCN